MMMLRECTIAQFKCHLITPFHTTQRSYANLLKCAPFIPGSALRGALVGHLIQTYCPAERIEQLKGMKDPVAVQEFHQDCQQDCPVRTFFIPGQVVFSSGEFADLEPARSYTSTTRIALTREERIASQGRIVSVEQIAPPAEFMFRLSLFEGTKGLIEPVGKALSDVGQYVGVGRFKSVGMGKFVVEERDTILTSLEDELENLLFRFRRIAERNGEKMRLSVATPLLMNGQNFLYGVNSSKLAQGLAQLLHDRAAECIEPSDAHRLEPASIARASVRAIPEFVTRYSLESRQREGRLAIWVGSEFNLQLEGVNETTLLQLALAELLGIGEWRDWGFGRLKVTEGTA
jgi:hypothetical protein